MARYIDIDKYFKDTFCDKYDDCTLEEECLECWAKRNTEDVAPVIHAKWIEKITPLGRALFCTNCDYATFVSTKKFCPNCGAKMA